MALLIKIFNRLEYLRTRRYLNIIKTLYINLRYLSLGEALKCPIYVYSGVRLCRNTGRIVFNKGIRRGMLKIGLPNYGAPRKIAKTVLNNEGLIVVSGRNVKVANGAELNILPSGTLKLGSDVFIGECVRVVCANYIELNSNVRIAYESQVIDSNFHYIFDEEKCIIPNCCGSIEIASNNWIGNRSNINKGTKTAPNQIFSAGSLLNKDYTHFGEGCVFVGTPARLLRNGLYRIFDIKFERKVRNYYASHDKVYMLDENEIKNFKK